jgi:hypothetical protein
MNRPVGVTIVAVLIFISALFNLAFGVWMMLAPIGNNPTVTDFLGNAQEIPGFYLFVNGLLSAILGLLYLWLMRLTLAGSETAYVLITVLSAINVFYGLLRLPYGWGIIFVSAIILLMVNTRMARQWFTRTA